MATLADAVVDGVRGNKPLVIPGGAAALRRLQRFAPRATASQTAKNMAREVEASEGG
jgi:hypothetical protein